MDIKKAMTGLNIILTGMIFHAFLCVMDFYTVKYNGIFYMLFSIGVCMLAAAAGHFAAKRINRNFVSFIATVAVGVFTCITAVFSVLPGMCIAFSVIVFVWIMLSRYKKSEKKNANVNVWFVLLFILEFFVGVSFEVKNMSALSVVFGIAFLIISVFLSGCASHEKFIEENISVSNFPLEQIRKTYISLLGVFTAGCLAITAAVCSVSFSGDRIAGFASDMLHNIYEFIPKMNQKPGVAKETPKMGGEVSYEQALIDFGIESKTNELVENIGSVLAYIIFAVSIALLLWWFLKRIINGLKQTRHLGADKLEFAFAEDVHDQIRKRKAEKSADEGCDKKIRKLYKKYVLKAAGKNVRASDTPGMLQNKIGADKDKGDIIRSVYEKARYSNYPCSKEDAEKIKKSMK